MKHEESQYKSVSLSYSLLLQLGLTPVGIYEDQAASQIVYSCMDRSKPYHLLLFSISRQLPWGGAGGGYKFSLLPSPTFGLHTRACQVRSQFLGRKQMNHSEYYGESKSKLNLEPLA